MTRPIVNVPDGVGGRITREMDDIEYAQFEIDQLDNARELSLVATEEKRVASLKASIAIKRTATTWQPFTNEEAAYLDSGS